MKKKKKQQLKNLSLKNIICPGKKYQKYSSQNPWSSVELATLMILR